MSEEAYPIVESYEHPDRGACVAISTSGSGSIYHLSHAKARLLATRLVEVVGCEQLEAERKRNEEIVRLLHELEWDMADGNKCSICQGVKRPIGASHAPDCRLRAALEGR
jgi:hypothetical protein